MVMYSNYSIKKFRKKTLKTAHNYLRQYDEVYFNIIIKFYDFPFFFFTKIRPWLVELTVKEVFSYCVVKIEIFFYTEIAVFFLSWFQINIFPWLTYVKIKKTWLIYVEIFFFYIKVYFYENSLYKRAFLLQYEMLDLIQPTEALLT